MIKLPKEVYLHWLLMILIFTMLIVALVTYVFVTAPIEINQRNMIKTVNRLVTECNFVENTPNYIILKNLTYRLNLSYDGEPR